MAHSKKSYSDPLKIGCVLFFSKNYKFSKIFRRAGVAWLLYVYSPWLSKLKSLFQVSLTNPSIGLDISECFTQEDGSKICSLSEGPCSSDTDCLFNLVCEPGTCGQNHPDGSSCCIEPKPCNYLHERTNSCCSSLNQCGLNEGWSQFKIIWSAW